MPRLPPLSMSMISPLLVPTRILEEPTQMARIVAFCLSKRPLVFYIYIFLIIDEINVYLLEFLSLSTTTSERVKKGNLYKEGYIL